MEESGVEKTKRLIQEWSRAKKRVETAKHELNRAECELVSANNSLGKWLVPPECIVNESGWFNIWFGSGVLRARRISENYYEVEWFRKPDGKDRNEYDY